MSRVNLLSEIDIGQGGKEQMTYDDDSNAVGNQVF
jgi:hypothetical protein